MVSFSKGNIEHQLRSELWVMGVVLCVNTRKKGRHRFNSRGSGSCGTMACAILSALLMLPANVCTASHELYENVLPANTSDCLDKVTVGMHIQARVTILVIGFGGPCPNKKG